MVMTRNTYLYGVIGLVSSLVFFYLLDEAVTEQAWGRIWPLAGMYGLVWAVSGWALSQTDSARKYRGNLGLAYHVSGTLATFVAASIALVLWDTFSLTDFFLVTFGMGLSLGLHWFFTRNQPKGIESKEAFK